MSGISKTRVISTFFVCLFLSSVFLNISFSDSASAQGETYSWIDKTEIEGREGLFTSDLSVLVGPGEGTLGVAEFKKSTLVVFDNQSSPDISNVTSKQGYGGTITYKSATNNCVLSLGIIVKEGNRNGTLVYTVPDATALMSGETLCTKPLASIMTVPITLANSDKSDDAETKQKLTVKVISYVEDPDNFPSDTETITLKNSKNNKEIGKKDFKKSDLFNKDGQQGFSTEFTVKVTEDKVDEITACSKALGICDSQTGLSDLLLTSEFGLIEIRLTPEPIDESATSCALEGVGWMVCPVASFLGGMTDQLYNFLKTLLVVEARMFSTSNDSYRAWEVMRNLANVAFVIAFLVVIYSQITGGGLSNYGVKKMLPRIIVAAILVNISYWICALAVDVSNILGSSLQSLLSNAVGGSSSSDNALTGWGEFTAWVLGGGTAALAIGGLTLVALGSGGFLAALALLLPVLITVLFAFITVILVLAARQAIIVILVIISPLAFVAYLLPNTEQYFKQWRKLFFTMLILFPIISVVFAGSQLASAVIRASTTSATVYILSLAVLAVPLFITPLVLKFSGGLLSRFGGMVNNPSKGPFDRLRKGAEGVRDRSSTRAKNAAINSDSRRNPFRRYLQRNARRDAIKSGREEELKHATTSYVADRIGEDAAFANAAAGGTRFRDADHLAVRRVEASARAARSKETLQNIDNIENTMDFALASDPARLSQAFMQATTIEERVAYARKMARNGSPGINTLRQTLSTYSDGVNRNNQDQVEQELNLKEFLAGDQAMKTAGRDFEVWSQNEGFRDAAGNEHTGAERSFREVRDNVGVWRDISAQRFASMSPASQGHALTLLEASDLPGLEGLINRIRDDSTALGNIKGIPQQEIQRIITDHGF